MAGRTRIEFNLCLGLVEPVFVVVERIALGMLI